MNEEQDLLANENTTNDNTEAETEDINELPLSIINEDEEKNEIEISKVLALNFEKLSKAFKEAGIRIVAENSKKEIIDYAVFINDLEHLFSSQIHHLNAFKQQYENDSIAVENIKKLQEDSIKIKKNFEIAMSFFTNPPSKEFLDLANNSALLNKLYADYKKFSDQAAGLNLEQMLSEHKNIFDKHLDEMESFDQKTSQRLEHIGAKYKEFMENMLKVLNEQLKGIQSQITAYEAIRARYEKTSKNLTRGLYGLISFCSLLCAGAGAFLGYQIFKIFG